jgi:protein AaeX
VRFTEIDVFGVYVAPMSLMMVAAWLVTIALRRVGSRFGLLRYSGIRRVRDRRAILRWR